jgi:hypothetical protein
MGKSHKVERPFKYFGWDEKNPIGKYKQPIKNDDVTGSGYPQTGIDDDDVTVYYKVPTGTKKKQRMEIKGTGAAEKGKKFFEND